MPATAPAPRPVRRSGVVLPEDPSDEELARNWTLSESDRREVLLCRGQENRLRFALQLSPCTQIPEIWPEDQFLALKSRTTNPICSQTPDEMNDDCRPLPEPAFVRLASPKIPAISERFTGLPRCVNARYGVYGQRFRYRWYSPERNRLRSAMGHRRLAFSRLSPRYSGITLNSAAHMRRPRVPHPLRVDSFEPEAAFRTRAAIMSQMSCLKNESARCSRLPEHGSRACVRNSNISSTNRRNSPSVVLFSMTGAAPARAAR